MESEMESEPLPSTEVHIKEEPEIKLEIKEERENSDGEAWKERGEAGTKKQETRDTSSEGREAEEDQGPPDEGGKPSGLECGLCGRQYSSLASLRGHLSRQHRVGSGYTCELCGAVGGTKAAFKRHLLRTHGPHTLAPHHFLTKCRHCGEGVATLPLLYQHIRGCHQDVLGQYHCCNHCPILFTTRQGLSRHYKRRHKDKTPPPMLPHVCRDCGAEFPTPAARRDHSRTMHPNTSPRLSADTSSVTTGFTCDQCPTVFACRSYLAKHIKKVHQSCPRPQSYRCGECGREYRHKARLQRHITTHHPAPGHRVLYSCPTCAKTFTSYENRKSHQRRAHRDRSLWQCGECHRGFLTSTELEMHRHARHKGACHVCGKVFLRRDSLREHLLIHNGPRLPCSYCPKTFTQASNLKRHIRIHTGEKPYQCTYCNKPFGDRSACKSHMLVHTGAGRCSCPTCGATFSKRQKLNYHMRLHTGDGLLHCPLCSRPATNTYDLKKHLETHQVALLTALRGSFLYSDVEDLPDLALKALHNLVWVAVQNSHREKTDVEKSDLEKDEMEKNDLGKVEVEKNDLGKVRVQKNDLEKVEQEKNDQSDSKEGVVKLKKLKENMIDELEKTDWSCVGVLLKNESINGSCSGTRDSSKLANGWNSRKNEECKLNMKQKSDPLTPNISKNNAKNSLDMNLEEKVQSLNKTSDTDNENSKRNTGDIYAYDSDMEQTPDCLTEKPESQFKKARRPRKMRYPRKSLLGDVLWERKKENGDGLSEIGLESINSPEKLAQEMTEFRCIEQDDKTNGGDTLRNCSLQNTTEHEKVEQVSAVEECIDQENLLRKRENQSSTGMQSSNDSKKVVRDTRDKSIISMKKTRTKKIAKDKMDGNKKRTNKKQTLPKQTVSKQTTTKQTTAKQTTSKQTTSKQTMAKQTIAPLAVLTQVIQFILGSLSTPPNTTPTNPNATTTTPTNATMPTLGDQLVEQCLEVIMRDGDDGESEKEEESNRNEMVMRDYDDDDASMRDCDDDESEKQEECKGTELIMRDFNDDDGDSETEEDNNKKDVMTRDDDDECEERSNGNDVMMKNDDSSENWKDENSSENQKEVIKLRNWRRHCQGHMPPDQKGNRGIRNKGIGDTIMRDDDSENQEKSRNSSKRKLIIMRDKDGENDSENLNENYISTNRSKVVLIDAKNYHTKHEEKRKRKGSDSVSGGLLDIICEKETVRTGDEYKDVSDRFKEHGSEKEDGLEEIGLEEKVRTGNRYESVSDRFKKCDSEKEVVKDNNCGLWEKVKEGNRFKYVSDRSKEKEDGVKENSCGLEEIIREGSRRNSCRGEGVKRSSCGLEEKVSEGSMRNINSNIDSENSSSSEENIAKDTCEVTDLDAKLKQSLTEENQRTLLITHDVLEETSTFMF